MSGIEEHKPVEKRRALGRGLDSLLPSGPRVVPPPAVVNLPSRTTSKPEVSPGFENRAGAVIQGENGAAAVPRHTADIYAAVPQPPQKSVSGGPGTDASAARAEMSKYDIIQQIPLDLIDENPYQTRITFDEAALNELAESIKANGLAQPVVVRPTANGRYILVLGERRCRASKIAQKTSVSAIVRQLGNEQAAEMTIVENLQRQDLNCLEQAQAFARLSQEFNLTQEQIGQRTGVSRESVANYMRLLKLPKPVLDLIGDGKLGFSEARVLLEAFPHLDSTTLTDFALNAVQRGFTVRDLKQQLESLLHPELDQPQPAKPNYVDPNVADAERRLREALGMRVRVLAHQGNKGQIVIRYESVADFDRVLELLEKN
jgi:ParB family transcriptional regulator, chromosome partitioning protein